MNSNRIWDILRALQLSSDEVSSGFSEADISLYLRSGEEKCVASEVVRAAKAGKNKVKIWGKTSFCEVGEFSRFLPNEFIDVYMSLGWEDSTPLASAIVRKIARNLTNDKLSCWVSGSRNQKSFPDPLLQAEKFLVFLTRKYIELVDDEESRTHRELTLASQELELREIIVVVLESEILARETWSS